MNVIFCLLFNQSVDGSWGDWSMWKSCNVTCGGGKQLRLRKCDRPVPAFGGLNCPSTDSEFRQCNTAKCQKGLQYLLAKQVNLFYLLWLHFMWLQ